jgi:aspartyl-tRNA(Asn)/glutamyl-tRNA(Gln) amidotransferase subunit A
MSIPGVMQARAMMDRRELTSSELVERCLARIGERNGELNAFVQVFGDEAREDARASDERVAAGAARGVLEGIPVALKDNIATVRGRTTCASRHLEQYRSPFDAAVVEKLKASGAIIIGKTNLDEFAMGGSGEHSAFGPTRNPFDASRVPGGSSSGSAAAVGAGMVPAALGSDTGGSIRQPAGWCGIAGCKPTYGRVSRFGLVAYASSLDQIGTMAPRAADAAAVLGVISGHDARDSTSGPWDGGEIAAAAGSLAGVRIGIPVQAADGNSQGVSKAMATAEDVLTAAGAKCEHVELPHAGAAIAAYYIIATAEASSNLARFDGVRYGRRAELRPGEGLMELFCRSRSEGLGAEVQKRIMLGTHVLSSGYYDAYYLTALKARRLIREDYEACFARGISAIMMPTSPGPAFVLGAKSDPLSLYLEDVYTVGVNLAGLPAVAVGCGRETMGERELPVGIQFIGPMRSESRLFGLAGAVERPAVAG